MSESEKKGSAWPWIAVPVCAIALFFVLHECQQRLPPAAPAPSHAAKAPPPDAPAAEPKSADSGAATPAPAPAPQ